MSLLLALLSLYFKIGIGITIIETIRWLIKNSPLQEPKAFKQWSFELFVNIISALVVWPWVLCYWYTDIKEHFKNEE